MNRQKQERARQNIFRTIAFGLMFLLLATSIAGIASILFQNSPLDETGSGENNVELANTLGASGQNGNSESTAWIISTKQDLQNWANSSSYWSGYTKLAADIDWGGSSGGNYPRVTSFSGTFDGQNHVVKNIYMNYTVASVGFFSTITGATIKNFGLVGGGITSSGDNVGGIVGSITGGTIIDVFNAAEITCTGNSNLAGGIAGTTTGAVVILRCFNIANIDGGLNQSGGIAGGNNGASQNVTIEKCFNTGNIKRQHGQSSGIVTGNKKSITDIYNSGEMLTNGTGVSSDGGLWGASAGTINRGYSVGKSMNGLGAGASVSSGYYLSGSSIGGTATGTALSQAQMTANNTLTSSMSGLGTTNWFKRTNGDGNLYYPELVAFAGTDGTGNNNWGRLKNWVADISKWSVTADKNTSAPTFTVGVAVSYTQPSEAQTTLPEYEGDGNTESLVINQSLLQASVPSGMTILWSDAQLKGTNPSTYIDMSTTSNSITLKSKFSDADRTFTLEFTLTPGNTGGIQALPTVVSLTIKVPKTPNIITII